MFADPMKPGVTMTSSGALLDQSAMLGNLEAYDHVMFSCAGMPETPTSAEASALTNYANAGGQVFLEHFHSTWITASTEWMSSATFTGATNNIGNVTVTIDNTFAGAQRMIAWMEAIGVSPNGQFPEIMARNTAQTVDMAKAQAWVHLDPATAAGTSGDQIFTFPSASSCGRVIFSDMHVTGATSTATAFPNECPPPALDPQQDALAFLFFDEQTCLQ
jgi:hypothetical protein